MADLVSIAFVGLCLFVATPNSSDFTVHLLMAPNTASGILDEKHQIVEIPQHVAFVRVNIDDVDQVLTKRPFSTVVHGKTTYAAFMLDHNERLSFTGIQEIPPLKVPTKGIARDGHRQPFSRVPHFTDICETTDCGGFKESANLPRVTVDAGTLYSGHGKQGSFKFCADVDEKHCSKKTIGATEVLPSEGRLDLHTANQFEICARLDGATACDPNTSIWLKSGSSHMVEIGSGTIDDMNLEHAMDERIDRHFELYYTLRERGDAEHHFIPVSARDKKMAAKIRSGAGIPPTDLGLLSWPNGSNCPILTYP